MTAHRNFFINKVSMLLEVEMLSLFPYSFNMNPSSPITHLLKNIIKWHDDNALIIKGLSSDSRETQPGDLFIAYAGPKAERPPFIAQAVKNGAIAVLQDTEQNTPSVAVQD